VFNSSLSKEDKLMLLALNNVKSWLVYDKDEIEIYERKDKKQKKELLRSWSFIKKLARKIFKHLLTRLVNNFVSGLKTFYYTLSNNRKS
jgi:putative transposase